MSLRTFSLALTAISCVTAIITQLFSQAKAQPPKPTISELLYVFRWPNGYSQVETESSMNSGIVGNLDYDLVAPELCIDASDAEYCFTIAQIVLTPDVVTALQSYGLVDKAGYDKSWPKPLPPLAGPATYRLISDPVLPPPSTSVQHAFDVLHTYYQYHFLELKAEAKGRDAASPSSSAPTLSPPITVKRIDYPSPSPTPH